MSEQRLQPVHPGEVLLEEFLKPLDLSADLQSIAASGWSAELIPEDDILQSQFSDVLEQIEKDRTRLAELEGLFAALDGEDAEEDESENGGESGVLP